MTFLYPIMLAGLAAVAAPIIIHLLNRRNARIVRWGAVMFLRVSLAARNRRMLLEEIVLLLARCAVPVLLFLAAARPIALNAAALPWPLFLSGTFLTLVLLAAAAVFRHRRPRRALAALAAAGILGIALSVLAIRAYITEKQHRCTGGRTDTVIILDGSRSMDIEDRRRRGSNFTAAVQEATDLIDSLHAGDTVGLLVAGPAPERLIDGLTYDHAAARQALGKLQHPPGGVADIPAALDAALDILSKAANPRRRIILFTDTQRIGWRLDDAEAWTWLRRRLTDPARPRPAILVRRFPAPEVYRNLTLEGFSFSREVVGTDSPVTIRVTVRNTGETPGKPDAIEIMVDDTVVSRRMVRNLIPAGNSITVPCTWHFRQPGIHLITVRLIAGDDLPADDAAVRVLRVLNALPVLLIEGTPAPGPLGGSTDYLRLALNPTAGSRDRGNDHGHRRLLAALAAPRTVRAADILHAGSPGDWPVIVLSNVRRLPRAAADAIAEAVRAGTGLFIAVGPDCDPDFYNHWLTSEGERICPLHLAAWTDFPTPRTPLPETIRHPAFDVLRRALERSPDVWKVHGAWRASRHALGVPVRIGGMLADGLPFLAEKDLGAGRVCMITFPLHPTVTTLPLQPVFVPAVDRLVAHLAASDAGALNLHPGRELILRLTPGTARGGRHGLLGEYFKGKAFEQRVMVRIDPGVDFNWGRGAPAPGVPEDHFSVRWTGWVSAPVSGRVRFMVTSDDGARLWVGGRRVINEWYDQYPSKHEAVVTMRKNQWTPIRLEYYENAGEAVIRLAWSGPGLNEQPVPADRLQPAPAPGLFGNDQHAATEQAERESAAVIRPDGREDHAAARFEGAALLIRYANTLVPGVYRLRLPPGLSHIYLPDALPEPSVAPNRASARNTRSSPATPGTGGPGLPFVVLDTPEESVLTPLSEADVRRLQADFGITWFEDPQDLSASASGRPVGVDLTRSMLAALLAVVVLETVLARWCTAQRRMHRIGAPPSTGPAPSAETG